MIAIPDSGEIIAKVKVVYDGSGVEEAKKDLASLGDIGSTAGQGISGASEALSGLDEQASKSAGSVHDLSSAFTDLPKIAEKSGQAFSSFGAGVAESQGAIDGMGTSVEELQAPLEKTSSLLEKASAPMSVISEHAQSVSDGFTQIGESLSQTVPMLPQFADSLHTVSESFNPQDFGLHDFAQNMSVFQEAMASPSPLMFQGIQDHLTATGQTWDDFISSVGGDNIAKLQSAGDATHQILGGMSSDVQSVGKTLNESTASTQAFTDQFGSMNVAAADANKTMSSVASNINAFGGVGSALYGPEIGLGKSIGFGEALSNSMGGVMGALNDIAMPIMAVQMIGMAVGQVAKGIYDMAAVAEGPGAHGVGTFTGTVDALGQSFAQVGQQFSEGFGQSIIPTLQQMNYQMSQAGGAGGAGGVVGGVLSTLYNLGRIGTGIDVQGGFEGLVNQFDAATGQPLQYQGPAPTSQSGQIAQQLAQATATMQAQANDPVYLAAQAFLGSQEQKAQLAQQSFDVSHYTGSTGPGDPRNAVIQYELARANGVTGMTNPDPNAAFFNSIGSGGGGTDMYYPGIPGLSGPTRVGQQTTSVASNLTGIPNLDFPHMLSGMGDLFSGIGGMFGGGGAPTSMLGGLLGGATFGNMFGGIGDIFSNLFGGGGQASVGCFPAGTRVRMADGSERAIETLQIGEQVLAHDGTQQVTTTVLARIVPPPKKVYELSFDDGNTLTLTDSHPISTIEGWKSLHPRATKQENPDLIVSTLHIGDTVHTTDGTVKLVGILPREIVQIYNLTVDEPHTFYANSVLVHNKALGGSMSANGTGDQQVSLSHTFTANVTWAASNLDKSFTAIANWAEQGVQHAVTAVANWAEENVIHPVVAAAQWAEENVMHAVTAVAQWTEQGVQHAVTAAAQWVEENVMHPVVAAAQWVDQNVMHAVTAVASWIGEGLEHTFNAVANWTAQNLTPSFTVNPSVTMLAEGTSNFSGGPAIVGEAGTEVVGINGQYSLFNQGASLVNLPAGASVYPMKDLNTSSPAQFANGTGGDTTPISLNMSGGTPQSFNISLHIDSQTLIAAMGIPMAQNIRLAAGLRSF